MRNTTIPRIFSTESAATTESETGGGRVKSIQKKALGKHTSAFEQSENGSNNLKKKALYKMMPSTSMFNTVDYVVKE